MKRIAIVLALVLLVVGVFAVAALTYLEIDRDVTYQVASDTAANVAVKFGVEVGYEDVAYLIDGNDGTNEIVFDLGGVLEAPGTHFNPEAEFHIGSHVSPVFTITNQTVEDIDVGLAAAADYIELRNTAGVAPGALAQWDGSPLTIASGVTEEFYFILDTTGALIDAGNPPLADRDLSTLLQIRLTGDTP